jgi:hypothetical protein
MSQKSFSEFIKGFENNRTSLYSPSFNIKKDSKEGGEILLNLHKQYLEEIQFDKQLQLEKERLQLERERLQLEREKFLWKQEIDKCNMDIDYLKNKYPRDDLE